jgi:hypothetical protein
LYIKKNHIIYYLYFLYFIILLLYIMAGCKPGKEKNANGRCVKIQNGCKAGKEKNAHGRCVKKCTQKQRRNRAGKCVSLKRPISYSIRSASSSHGTFYSAKQSPANKRGRAGNFSSNY